MATDPELREAERRIADALTEVHSFLSMAERRAQAIDQALPRAPARDHDVHSLRQALDQARRVLAQLRKSVGEGP